MSHPTIRTIMLREMSSLVREVQAYPDDDSLWHTPAGITNSGGTLILHLAGNLKHFVGAVLGGTGYVRERDAEFSRRGLTRAQLTDEVEEAARVVDETLAGLSAGAWGEPYPIEVGGRTLRTSEFLIHLASHLAYHLGQIDYHRRITTGAGHAVKTVSIAELADASD